MAQSNLSRSRRFFAASAAFAVVIATQSVGISAAQAEAGSIVGSWSGGGSISFSTGSKEKARCRASYSKAGGIYVMSATCATASASVQQSARLRKTGANSYSGSFFNPQYNTGGQIFVTVRGGSQSVRLSGEAGSALFNLRRL